MSARFAIFAVLAATLITFGLDSEVQAQRIPAAPIRFSMQDQEKQDESLEDKLKRMELRLRELEDDVAKKLEAEAASDSDSLSSRMAARIESLESRLESQEKVVSDLNGLTPGLLFHSHGGPRMQFFGRIHLDYWAFPNEDATLRPLEGGDDPQDRFELRRARLGVMGDLNDNMFYRLEGELGEFAGGNNLRYRDVFLGFRHLPYLNTVIIGNHKRPYGLDHLNDSNFNVFMERPFIVESFNEDSRRLGISSNGVSEDLGWNWRFGYWNQVLTPSGFGFSRSGYRGDKYQGEFAARIARTAWYDDSSGGRGWAHVGISGSFGAPDGFGAPTGARYRTRPESLTLNRWLDTGNIAGANANHLVGLETAFNVGAFNFTGEYMRVNVDRLDGVGEDVAFEGYYGQVSYFLTGEHRPWDRQTGTLGRVIPFENFFIVRDCDCNVQRGWGAWEVAARYSFADLTDQDIIGGEGESFTFGLNWYWNPYARMQFNYLTGDIDRGAAGFGDYEAFGVRMMVDF